MAAITVRKLDDEVHRALKQQAARHGRSTEAEARAILTEAMQPEEELKLGTYLFERSREFGGVDLDIERDKSPVQPASFE